jgi:hypothetical protein
MQLVTYLIIVEICKQVAILILHQVSRLAAQLKFIHSSVQVSDVLIVTVRCKLINFVFQIFLFFIPEMCVGFGSSTVQVIPICFTWILYPLKFSLFPLM